jgi:hypothetical protein
VITPAHIVLNAYALGSGRFASFAWPIALGAVLPDLPMFLFYVYQRGWLSLPERMIWTKTYFLPHWQSFFDAFNSLPLFALGAVLAWRAKRYAWLACLASMALHGGADLLVHHEDAHGHFWPLSAWRFRSPVSYWDPRHHGRVFAVFELASSIAVSAALWRRGGSWRWIGGGVLACMGVFAVSALLHWRELRGRVVK